MSEVRIDTSDFVIASCEIIKLITQNRRYLDYNEFVLEKIVLEIITEYEKVVIPNNIAVFDDEMLFDDIFIYMLKRLDEISPSDIAIIIDDVMHHFEDIFFDNGLFEFTSL